MSVDPRAAERLGVPVTDRPGARGRAARMVARAVVGALIVAVLLARTGVERVRGSLAHADPTWIVFAFGVLIVALVVNALRWRLFLRPLGIDLSVPRSIRLTFIGTFFNAFLPTGVGGDAYKTVRLRTTAGSLSPPLASVVLDRLAGLVGLAALGLAGGGWLRDRHPVTITILLTGVGVLASSGLALGVARGRDASGPSGPGIRSRARAFVAAFVAALAVATREPAVVGAGMALGIVSALLLVAVHVILAASLGLSIPLAAWPGIVLIATLTTMVPVSINGLGFREAAYIWCLGAYGVGRDDALAFAVLVLALTLASSAVGGIVYVFAGGSERLRSASEDSPGRRGPTPRSAG